MNPINRKVSLLWNGREIEVDIHNYNGDSIVVNYEGTMKIDGAWFFGGFIAKNDANDEQALKEVISNLEESINYAASDEAGSYWKEMLQWYKQNGKSTKACDFFIENCQKRQPIAKWLVKTFNL